MDMTELKSKIMRILETLSTVKVGVWVRLILMIVSFINLGLVTAGKTPVSVENEAVYTLVSYAAAIVIGVLNYWKNNSITKAAQKADEFLHNQGFADEDPGFNFNEDFDDKFGIDDTIELINKLMRDDIKDDDKATNLINVLYKFETWVNDNPDKVEAIENKLGESVQSFVDNVKAKINE